MSERRAGPEAGAHDSRAQPEGDCERGGHRWPAACQRAGSECAQMDASHQAAGAAKCQQLACAARAAANHVMRGGP
eukprot:1587786-Alexandrium_andersonii.AAC.1